MTVAARGLTALRGYPLLVTALLCVLSLVYTQDTLRGQAGKAAEKRPFPHTSHVADTWYYHGGKYPSDPKASKDPYVAGEVARDCRGCHDYGEKAKDGTWLREPRSPMSVCKDCHYGDVLAVEIQAGFEAGLRAGRGSTSAFEHLDHDNMACRECHVQSKDDPESFGGATGVPACMTCHTDGGAERTYDTLAGRSIDKRSVREGFLEWLNADASMALPGRGPYPHDRHIAPEKRKDAASCVQCHGDVDAATALDLHLKEYTAAECARCHVQADGKPVDVQTVYDQRPSAAAKTFAHADHLHGKGGVEDLSLVQAGSRERLEKGGCLECHEHTETARVAADGVVQPPSYTLRADREDYAGCMSCHDVAAFRAPHHGQWDNCSACHTFDGADHAAFKHTRPQVAVDRLVAGEVRFLVDAQRHPGLAGQVDQDCLACHRAALPVLPSRVNGARFEHSSHLPAQPTTQDCLACHSSVSAAATSAGIGLAWQPERSEAASAQQRASFSMAGCGSCHPGIRIDERSLTQPTPKNTVAFNHADHMAKARDPLTGQPVSCVTCHDFDPKQRGSEIGVRPTASSCVQCHAHDDAHAQWTGGVGAAEAASCARCHTDAVPTPDVPVLVQRARIALQGKQHHPPGMGCFECHLQEPLGRLAEVSAVLSSFPKGDRQHLGGRPAGCSDCHWSKAPPSFPEAAVDAATRRQLGNSLLNFPGQKGVK